jgi:hypothetical protein
LSFCQTNCTHSDSVLKGTVNNKIKYNNNENKNRYSSKSFSLEIYTVVKNPLFLIMEAIHSTEETVYIYQKMQEYYPLVFVNLYHNFKFFVSLLGVYKCNTFTEGTVRCISRENMMPFCLNICCYNSKLINQNRTNCCS